MGGDVLAFLRGPLPMLPPPPITTDQLALLKTDNVVADGAAGLADLGIAPAALEPIIPTYLYRYRKGGQYADLDAAGGAAGVAATYSSNPTNTMASSTDLRWETTALAGKLSSGKPMATQIMITWSSAMPACSRTTGDCMMPWLLITQPRPRDQAALTRALVDRAAVERGDVAAVDRAVVGHDHRDRRVELAKAAQHPVLAPGLVVPFDAHGGEQLLGDLDLPLPVRAGVFAVAAELARRRHAGQVALGVAGADAVERRAGDHVEIPGLRVERRRRAHRDLDHLPDQGLRHRIALEAADASAPQNDVVERRRRADGGFHRIIPIHALASPSIASPATAWAPDA